VALSLACKPMVPRSIPQPAGLTHLTHQVSVHQLASSISSCLGGLPPLPFALSWRLSSRGRAAQPPMFPHPDLSRQQVRADHRGVCRRLHPDAADPNTPAALACSLQNAGARSQRDEERGEPGRQGKRWKVYYNGEAAQVPKGG